jgi:F-type H+-transporting ATPase subunit alpha
MQQLNPSEISDLIKQRIDQLDVSTQATNEGTIVSVTDGIIRIHGLTEVQYGEMIEFEGGVYGLALNLERDSVGAVVLGDYKQLAEGQTCRCTGRFSRCRLGRRFRAVWWIRLGNPIDGKGAIEPRDRRD